jgi:hypothetical protein
MMMYIKTLPKEKRKELRWLLEHVIENNNGNCSVCVQHLDSSLLSFANMRDMKTSWGKEELSLYTPKEITFVIPYTEILSFSAVCFQLNITLSNRMLVSVRGLQGK